MKGRLRMAFRRGPGVEYPPGSPCASGIGAHGVQSTTRPAMEASMNPLDSITGTIVSGVILTFILVALF